MSVHKHKLPETLQHELLRFFQTHPPDVFSQRLRCLLLEYLSYELRTSIPLYLPEFLYSLYDLFNVLDTASEDFSQPKDKGR